MSFVRKCSKCGIANGHNCRTCPLNRDPSPASVAATFQENHAAPAEEIDSCPICMDPIGKTNCATTACGHKFCLECFLKHSQTKNQCPLCRGHIAGASDVDWKAQYDDLHQHALDIERRKMDYWDVIQQQQEIIRQIDEERVTLRREIEDLRTQIADRVAICMRSRSDLLDRLAAGVSTSIRN
jgi:hypothetical protein